MRQIGQLAEPKLIYTMKTILLTLAAIAAVLLFPLVGLGYAEAFSIITALSIVAMLALDFELSSPHKRLATVATRDIRSRHRRTERHPLAS